MAREKAQVLRDLSGEELEARLGDLQKEVFELRNQRQREKKVEKPHLLRETRREIARVITILDEKRRAHAGVEE